MRGCRVELEYCHLGAGNIRDFPVNGETGFFVDHKARPLACWHTHSSGPERGRIAPTCIGGNAPDANETINSVLEELGEFS